MFKSATDCAALPSVLHFDYQESQQHEPLPVEMYRQVEANLHL